MTPSLELLEGCLKNDRKSQHQLYSLGFSFMMGVCQRYAGNRDEACALVNLGFLKMLLNLGQYRSEIPFEVWTRTILIRTAIDEFRKNKNYRQWMQPEEDLPVLAAMGNSEINAAEHKLNAEYIDQCMQRLPPMSRQVFNLFAIDGYPHKEIAALLGITEGTTKWHVNFARQKLKEMILELIKQEAVIVYEK